MSGVRCLMSDVGCPMSHMRALLQSQFLTDFDEIWHSCKMAKGVNLKFGMHDPRQSLDVTPEKNSRKGGGVRVT